MIILHVYIKITAERGKSITVEVCVSADEGKGEYHHVYNNTS